MREIDFDWIRGPKQERRFPPAQLKQDTRIAGVLALSSPTVTHFLPGSTHICRFPQLGYPQQPLQLHNTISCPFVQSEEVWLGSLQWHRPLMS